MSTDDNDVSYGALMMLCEGRGTSEIYRRVQAALAAKDQQLDTLLGEAVWAMEVVRDVSLEHYGSDSEMYKHAAAFLARPAVREWQARQKEVR